ncbi:2TM domain-containing protein [Rasiella sp. SM2506]|uniref:2TM domain-containing protein n=1 Tax=Rasiella sp. SM2506 TaxID=3423914 RepID=UPI003D793BF3
MMNTSEKEKLAKAKKRLEKIKGFYIHAMVYALVNIFLMLSATGIYSNGLLNLHMPGWAHFTTPFFWGIGLFFHGLNTFKSGLLKKWEDRKIKEYLEKEARDFEKFN